MGAGGKTRTFWIGAVAILGLFVSACGPKDIESGLPEEENHYSETPTAAEQMRYPMLGTSLTQRMLYHYNRPDVMENTQKWQVQEFHRLHGGGTESNPEGYKTDTHQFSPFAR